VRWVTSRAILSDLQADVAKLLWSQAQILTQMRELRKMKIVVAEPGDRGAALAELWQLREALSETDPDLAAQLHSIYNQLVVSKPDPGQDAA
jgi:hypothetical protein